VERAVFLDRDNTLIANDGDLGDPEQVRLLEGVSAGLRTLQSAGYRLIVVTNQAGVARGVFTEDDVDHVHQRIASLVDQEAKASRLIDRFYYCPYHPEGEVEEYRRDHPWRKPRPGMLIQAARDLGLDLSASWMIGDRARDVQAGAAAGCRTVLVNRNGAPVEAEPTHLVKSFPEAVQAILRAKTPPDDPIAGHASSAASSGGTIEQRAAHVGAESASASHDLRRAIADLTEEIRANRLRRGEFTALRLTAGLCQLLAVLLAVLGVTQLGSAEVFLRWMAAAIFVQLITIALLVLDSRG
jgi:D,D-heptose 1,7-bisphosphate phosphatase